MNNSAKIKIGLLGGRGYGKTVFITKLISLADCNEDGFLQFDAGAEALQIKNIMLENDGILPATEIKEFSNYKFILGKQSGEKWRIQFCDYAGELLERIDISPEIQKQPQEGNDNFLSNEGTRQYIRRVKKWLAKCDAYIVLMPVDVTNAVKYPNDEVSIYRQNIGLLLKIMQDDPILKNRPVCLAVNKWDLAENEIFDELIKREPFSSFKQQLVNVCSKNLFSMPISAFGQHLKDKPDKADPKGKPINVSELLIQLAQRAERAKIISIKNAIKTLPAFFGWIMLPRLLCDSWLSGATTPRFIKLNRLLYKKYWKRFAINGVTTVVAVLLLFSVASTAFLRQKYKSWERQIDNGFYSPEMISSLEKELYTPRTFNFMFGKLALLKINRYEVQVKFTDEKQKYNQRIWKSAKKYRDERFEQIFDLSVSPEIRQKRVNEIKDNYDKVLKELTIDARERMDIAALQKEAETWRTKTAENRKFDEAYNTWLNITDEYAKAIQAAVFLEKYTIADYPARNNQIENVRNQRKTIEEEKFLSLHTALHRQEFANDFNEETGDYSGRIKRAKQRIEEIKHEIGKLPCSHKMIDMQNLLRNEEARITYLEKYGPFDVEVSRLLALTDSGTIAKLQKFIVDNRNSYNEHRSGAFESLRQRIAKLNNLIFKDLQKRLDSPQYADVKTAKYRARIQAAEKRISFINAVLIELTDLKLKNETESLCNIEKNLINELNLYGPFDEELSVLEKEPNAQKITSIEKFLKKYPRSRYPLREQTFIDLTKTQTILSDSFYGELEKRLNCNPSSAKWRERIKIAQENKKIIAEYRKKFATNSPQAQKCDKRIKSEDDLISQVEYDGAFDDAYDVLVSKNRDNSYIRAVAAFCQKYTADTFPRRKDKIDALRKECKELEAKLYTSLLKDSASEKKTWKERVAIWRTMQDDIRKGILFFTATSAYVAKLNEKVSELNAKIGKETKYGEFDDEWESVDKKISVQDAVNKILILDEFLATHPQKNFLERSDVFTKAKGEWERSNAKVRESYLKKLKEDYAADNDELAWDNKIARAQHRIEICNAALKDISPRSIYRREFTEHISNARQLIESINGYKEYYVAYSDVESKNDLYRISAIDAFIKKYQGQYPQPIARYTIEKLQEDREALLVKHKERLEIILKKFSDQPTECWEHRHNLVKKRLDALHEFAKSTGIDSRDQISTETALEKEIASNIRFSRDLAVIKGNVPAKELFKLIYNFYIEYPEADWSARKDEYQSIHALKKTTIDTLQRQLQQSLEKYTDFSSIQASIKSYGGRVLVFTQYQDNFLPAMGKYKSITSQINSARESIARLRKVQIAKQKLEILLSEASTLSAVKRDDIGTFLIGVERYCRQYPNAESERFLQEQFKSLLKVKDEWNDRLYEKLKQELNSYEAGLESASDAEKNELYDKMFSVYNKYLGLFSPDGNKYELACRERDNKIGASERFKKEYSVKLAIDEVTSKLNDKTLDSSSKINAIQIFNNTIQALGKPEEFPRFRTEFNYINNICEILQWDQRWNEMENAIDKEIKNPPSTDDEEKIENYLTICKDYIRGLREFMEYPRLSEKANEKRLRLQDLIDKYTDIAEECRLFNSVKDASNAYYDAPGDDTYQDFQDTVCTLRDHSYKNPTHKKAVTELFEKARRFDECRKTLETGFYKFRNDKKSYSLEEFLNQAKAYAEMGGKNPITEYADQLAKVQYIPVTVKLISFDYSDSGFESGWGRDVDFYASVGGISALNGSPISIVFNVPDIDGDNKNRPNHDDLKRRLGAAKISSSGCSPIKNKITVEFKNYNFRDDIGSDSVDFAWILASAMDSEECEYEFSSVSKRKRNLGQGHVYINFSGLPRYIR